MHHWGIQRNVWVVWVTSNSSFCQFCSKMLNLCFSDLSGCKPDFLKCHLENFLFLSKHRTFEESSSTWLFSFKLRSPPRCLPISNSGGCSLKSCLESQWLSNWEVWWEVHQVSLSAMGLFDFHFSWHFVEETYQTSSLVEGQDMFVLKMWRCVAWIYYCWRYCQHVMTSNIRAFRDVTVWTYHTPEWKLTCHWKIPIFSRKYIFK